MLAGLPYGAMPHDTAEYMLGTIAVTPVLLESNGEIDRNVENWNEAHIQEVLLKLNESFQWWENLLASQTPNHELKFVLNEEFASKTFETAYEPINRRSDDYRLWVSEFLAAQGFNNSIDLESNIRDFNHAQRLKLNTDWAFTVFVVNSQIDGDGTFASGGTFSRAFAFAGGLFYVVPSTRPASTFTHETGHIFYAYDEYSGGESYFARRGYYNAQNLNALQDNPDPNFVQAPSIMAAGPKLLEAYQAGTSPASTLAMIGWRDSDGNGVFDVLDVPVELNGYGRFDPLEGVYRFQGSVKVGTLPNQNSSGLQNDISTSRVSRIEYRFPGTDWRTAITIQAAESSFDISIPTGIRRQGTIEIRALSTTPGVVSPSFIGNLSPTGDAMQQLGITGFVYGDWDASGTWGTGEDGRASWRVHLLDNSGQPLNLHRRIEPDDQPLGLLNSNAYPGVTLSTVGLDAEGGLGVFNDPNATTGSRVFRPYSVLSADFSPVWTGRNHQLKIDFHSPTSYVSVDIIGAQSGSIGRLEIYDAAGNLIDRVTSGPIGLGRSTSLEVATASATIASAIVRAHANTSIKIDNLRYGPKTSTTTDRFGYYAFTGIPAGDYRVRAVPPSSAWRVTSPPSGVLSVSYDGLTEVNHRDFGAIFEGSPWHHASFPEDVNKNGQVTPQDALIVINLLNRRGIGPLDSSVPTTFGVDVNGDGALTPMDALMVINYLNARGSGGSGGGGEGESGNGGGRFAGPSSGGSGPGQGEQDDSSVQTPLVATAQSLSALPESFCIPKALDRTWDGTPSSQATSLLRDKSNDDASRDLTPDVVAFLIGPLPMTSESLGDDSDFDAGSTFSRLVEHPLDRNELADHVDRAVLDFAWLM